MEDLAQNQAYSFVIYIASGILIGIFFDIFRIHRRSFRTPDFITYIQDIIFWVITGAFFLYIIFKFNNGELRWYIFLGTALGILIYMLLFSQKFIKINVAILKGIKSIFSKIWKVLLIPIKWLRKLIFKPISFAFINIRKMCKNFFLKVMQVFRHKKTKNI